MDAKEFYMSKPWLKYYEEGVPAEVEIPNLSVPEVFDQTVEKYGKKTALIFYGKSITFNKLKEEVDRFATALADLGVSKGDTVALYLLNCPQYVISYFGAMKCGAKITPISPVYTSKEIKHQFEDSDTKVLVCEDILYDNVEMSGFKPEKVIITHIKDYLPVLKKLFSKSKLERSSSSAKHLTPEEVKSKGLLLFTDLIKNYPPEPPKIEFDPENDIAALPYTGGTTGLPKAAIITHRNMVAVQKQTSSFWTIFEEGNETVIAFLPFFHIYGQVVVMLNGLVQGHTLVLFTTPDLDDIIAAMERYNASGFFGVPTLYDILKDYEKTDRVNWKKLKLLACGADTLHESTYNEWERRTGTSIVEGYGMTETTSISHGNPYSRSIKGSFGIPFPSITAAIVDVEGMDFMPVDEVGELILNGPNIMKGYWKRPEETAESLIDIDGKKWLRTGDLVRMNKEGYFFFFDRKRDLIKYKGYSVFARHVEEVLYQHPQVKAAGVVGVPDPSVGNYIKAFVVLQSEARGKVSEEEIMEFCKQNLAHYKVPKIIEFRGELPKTDVGKVSRRELREEEEEA